MRTLTTVLLATMLATSAALAQERRVLAGDAFNWNERIARGSWLRIYDPNGRIDVTEASGEVAEVRAERTDDRRDSRREEVSIQIQRDGSGVTICALIEDSDCDEDGVRTHNRRRWRDDDERARIHFSVRLPRGVRLKAGTGNGEVSVTGAAAEVVASSGNGRVRVTTSEGAVQASSGNGEVSVDGATERVNASSGNGSVHVTTRKGPVSASSGNGDIEVRMLTIGDDDDMHFSTGNGRISVSVPSSFTGEIEGTLGHGEFRSDFPLTIRGKLSPTHIRASVGTGGSRVRMTSGNGDLELLKSGR